MNRSKGKSLAISIILTVIFALVIFYVRLPAINLKDPGFYGFFVIVAVFYCLVSAITKGVLRAHATPQETWHELKTNCAVPLIICAALIVLLIVGHIIGAPLFRANAYRAGTGGD